MRGHFIPHTEETKKKISEHSWMKGKKGKLNPSFGKKHLLPMPKETREKISSAKKGKPTWNKGIKNCFSKETIQKMSRSHRGELAPNWQGGKTQIGRKIKCSLQYREWRSKIFQRDNWTCQTCFIRDGRELHPHHIKEKSLIIKDNHVTSLEEALNCNELWDINNGITLCKDCHKLTKNYGNRKKL